MKKFQTYNMNTDCKERPNNWNSQLGKLVLASTSEFMYCAGMPSGSKRTRMIQVRWEKPSLGWVKLNTDGSSLGNPGRDSGGGLIRDSNGKWMTGFCRNIGVASSIEVELWTLRDGLSLCINLNLVAVEIEVNAKVVVGWIINDFNSNLHHASHTMDYKTLIR